ncbi:hypothetical protein HUJ04_012629 [Dendroctonus ponderosae]|nr:hypothetical protein HUJ04_012629 [Dendroctonus ponderosae]
MSIANRANGIYIWLKRLKCACLEIEPGYCKDWFKTIMADCNAKVFDNLVKISGKIWPKTT